MESKLLAKQEIVVMLLHTSHNHLDQNHCIAFSIVEELLVNHGKLDYYRARLLLNITRSNTQSVTYYINPLLSEKVKGYVH